MKRTLPSDKPRDVDYRLIGQSDLLDVPEFLRLSPEQRRQAWIDNPPKPFVVQDTKQTDPGAAAVLAEHEYRKALRKKVAKEKRSIQPIDTLGLRWNPRICNSNSTQHRRSTWARSS